MHAMTIISVLVFVFIIIPALYWWIRLAWWLMRVAYISLLILICERDGYEAPET
jgi:hypothetical protein